MSGPDGTKEASERPSSQEYTECTATERAVPSERKPGEQLGASPTPGQRENTHTEMSGKG